MSTKAPSGSYLQKVERLMIKVHLEDQARIDGKPQTGHPSQYLSDSGSAVLLHEQTHKEGNTRQNPQINTTASQAPGAQAYNRSYLEG
jgi:hypothetical protein